MRGEITMSSPLKASARRVPDCAGISMENPQDVLTEVKNIILLMFDQKFDFSWFDQVVADILKLFDGNYPGYRRCNTRYHDLHHTMACLLVMARLIDGASLNGMVFGKMDVTLGLISALMHDTGYIQAEDDKKGTGAQYTLCHIDRSIIFMKEYFYDHGLPAEYASICSDILRCTGLDVKIAEIKFKTREQEILGKILGAADLIGQMADEHYLEKLPFLYYEFNEGGVPGYENELDLLMKTPAFWEMVKERLRIDLGHVDLYLLDYFRVRKGINQDLYRGAIERNIERLKAYLAGPRRHFPGIPRAATEQG